MYECFHFKSSSAHLYTQRFAVDSSGEALGSGSVRLSISMPELMQTLFLLVVVYHGASSTQLASCLVFPFRVLSQDNHTL